MTILTQSRQSVRASVLVLLAVLLLPAAASPQDAPDTPGRSDIGAALLAAARDGSAQGVTAALGQGADVDYREADGWTALLFAAVRGHEEIVRLLIAAGADVDVQNLDGATPLMGAAVSGERGIVEMLVAAGADLSLRNAAGATARTKAEEYGHRDVAAWLAASEQKAALAAAAAREPEPPPAAPAETLAAPEVAPPAPAREPPVLEIEPMYAVYVVRKGAVLRSAPRSDADRLGSLPEGKSVTVTGKVTGLNWYRIENGEVAGFLYGTVLEEPAEPPEEPAEPREEPPEPPEETGEMPAPVEPEASSEAGVVLLSGRWASERNPNGCVGEYLEIRVERDTVSVSVRAGGEVFALADALPITYSEGNQIEAGSPLSGWRFAVSARELVYSHGGRDPVRYLRCDR